MAFGPTLAKPATPAPLAPLATLAAWSLMRASEFPDVMNFSRLGNRLVPMNRRKIGRNHEGARVDDESGSQWRMRPEVSVALLLALIVALLGARMVWDEPPVSDWTTLAIGVAAWWAVFTLVLMTGSARNKWVWIAAGPLVLLALVASLGWGIGTEDQADNWLVAAGTGAAMAVAMGWLATQNRPEDGILGYIVVGEVLLIAAGLAIVLLLSNPMAASSRFSSVGSCEGCLGRPRRRRGRLVPSDVSPHWLRSVQDVWARAAVEEHHSVEAFETLAARLGNVGAPEDLVVRSHAAARDEVRHAATCRRFAGVSAALAASVPCTQRTRTRAARRVEVLRLAIESYVDGVVGEGIGAELLRSGADTALPQRRAALVQMAADEQRHAELAADIVTWAHAMSPRLVRAALFACDRQLQRQPLYVSTMPLPDETLRLAGMVPPRETHDLAQQQRHLASTWLQDAIAPSVRSGGPSPLEGEPAGSAGTSRSRSQLRGGAHG